MSTTEKQSNHLIQKLIDRHVNIPCPGAIVIEDIDPNRIMPGSTLYPGTILRGPKTYIGKNAQIGAGGGAFIENAQFGNNTVAMQGTYRDCTLLNHVTVRNGAEIREGCLLEEFAELGHTVGLKQTILFPNVVAGSIINFCDALVSGGTSRKNHSEIGSCMALYNFTPQGDKFASLFGNVEQGLFLNQSPIFIGGQTQIVSPVSVGFGSVIAAGSRLTHPVESNHIFIHSSSIDINKPFQKEIINRPLQKVNLTIQYIKNLELLRTWYNDIRIPLYENTDSFPIMLSALEKIELGIHERKHRLSRFRKNIQISLEYIQSNFPQDTQSIHDHEHAIHAADDILKTNTECQFHSTDIYNHLKQKMNEGMDYISAIQSYIN